MEFSRCHPETRAAQALGAHDPETAGVIPAVQLSTTYLRAGDNTYQAGRVYGRGDNPTPESVEALLASLENGEEAMVFSSGMTAAIAVFLSLKPGDHIIAPQVMYWGLRLWLQTTGIAWGLKVTFVAMDNLVAVRQAVQPGKTKLIWIETPANPIWSLTDIQAVAEIAHAVGARLAVDNTVPTPVHTRPLTLGADIVMHSATKYLNGHSDVIAGALITAKADETWDRIRAYRKSGGIMLSPWDAFLLLRGMRTLFLRVTRASATAQVLAEKLYGHPLLEAVLYPGLSQHPGHEIARRQMQNGYGGMLSIIVAGGAARAIAVAAAVKLWVRATSLGGPESLIEHRASVEGGSDNPVPPGLLRLSVGLEHPNDLLDDLIAALKE
ncbi:MAG: PLP-dependent aspartate aminotransferase family protein [Alphaproteobacteria bacterium]